MAVPRSSKSRVGAAIVAIVTTLGLAAAGCATPVVTQSMSSIASSEQDAAEALPTVVAAVPTAVAAVPTTVPVEPAVVADDEIDDGLQPTPVPTPPPNPGVSDDAIRIVAVNDVDTGGIADNIFLSARQGIAAWVTAVNAAGGLAGREVQLFVLESAVINHRAVIETLCGPNSSVLALVGSLSLQDGDGLDVMLDPSCRMPDFPALAITPARRDSNITFLTNPQRNLFYDVSTLQYVADRIREEDPSAALRVSDVQIDQGTFTVRNQRMKEAARNIGFTPGVSYSSSSGETIENQAQALLDRGIETLVWTADPQRLAELLVAMGELNETDPLVELPSYVVCDIGCYDPAFVDAVGDYGNNVYTSIPHRVVTETDVSEMREFLFWLNETDPTAVPTSYGLHAWAAGRLFEQSVNLLVGTGGPDQDFAALNREGIIEAARQIENWNGRFLFGSFSRPTSSLPGDCTIVLNLQDGEWVPVRPDSGVEAFNCDPTNLTRLEATVDFGLDEGPVLSATSSEEAAQAGEDVEPEPVEELPADEVPAEGELVDDLEQTEEIPDE